MELCREGGFHNNERSELVLAFLYFGDLEGAAGLATTTLGGPCHAGRIGPFQLHPLHPGSGRTIVVGVRDKKAVEVLIDHLGTEVVQRSLEDAEDHEVEVAIIQRGHVESLGQRGRIIGDPIGLREGDHIALFGNGDFLAIQEHAHALCAVNAQVEGDGRGGFICGGCRLVLLTACEEQDCADRQEMELPEHTRSLWAVKVCPKRAQRHEGHWLTSSAVLVGPGAPGS